MNFSFKGDEDWSGKKDVREEEEEENKMMRK
jgi:hypothetical protein